MGNVRGGARVPLLPSELIEHHVLWGGHRGDHELTAEVFRHPVEANEPASQLASSSKIDTGNARVGGEVISVNTSQDRDKALGLKLAWTETALTRMRRGAPGNYGYSVFAISRRDLRRLRDVHLEYVRAMQSIIAGSKPGECVGLYCAQLLDLAQSKNALADNEAVDIA